MDQAEVTIHEVEVQVQTLPPCGFNERTLIRAFFLEQERKGAAGFKNRENTHETMLDSVAVGEFPCGLFLLDVGCEVLERSSVFFGHRDRMILHAFGVLEQEPFQIAEI